MASIDKIQVQGTGYDIIAASANTAKAYDSAFTGTNSIKTALDEKSEKENSVYYVPGTHSYPAWQTNHAYAVGDLVSYSNTPYSCKTAHTSGSSFVSSNWTRIATTIWEGTVSGVDALYTGMKIAYKIPIAGGSSSTYLNINGLGNHYVRRNDGNTTTHLPINTVVFLCYDGTYWRWPDYDSNTNNWVTTMGAYCDTAAATQAKTATSTNTVYTAGESFLIRIVNSNTYDGKITLNINSQGAKDVWINGEVSSSTNKTLPAGEHWCYYDGTVFHIWTNGTAQFKNLKAETFTGNVSGIASNAVGYTNVGGIATALGGKVPSGRKVNGKALSADITLNAADVSAISTAARGAVNGVASLGANGKVPTGQLPDMQSLTAGTDLKIADNIISVNTDGTIGNSAEMSFVAGSGTYASGVGAAAFGHKTSALKDYSFAEGNYTKASGNGSHTEGNSTLTIGNYSHAEGDNVSAVGYAAHAEGQEVIASGTGAHAEGRNTLAGSITGDTSFTNYTTASHAEGYGSSALHDASHAEGFYTLASEIAAHAEGSDTSAAGSASHAEGSGTSAVGENSHTEGRNTLASGNISHAEGNYTSAIGNYSHAGGSYTIASGDCSHIVGHYTKSYSDNSLVANFNNVAVGEATYSNDVLDTSRISNNLTSWSAAATTMPYAFSNEGYFNLYDAGVNTAEFAPYYGAMTVFGMNNTAMGRATMAIGYGNAAITPYSLAAGKGNFTTEYGQTVVGCWREPSNITSARFIVGGGSSNTSRKNLLEVGDNKIYTPCDVKVGGNLIGNNSLNLYGNSSSVTPDLVIPNADTEDQNNWLYTPHSIRTDKELQVGGEAYIGGDTTIAGSISAIATRPQMTLQYTSALTDEISYSSNNPKLYFSGKNGSNIAEGALVFAYHNQPRRFGTQLDSYYASGIGGWFGFSMEDGDCSGVGVVADLYSATYITATHTLAASTGSYAYGSNGSNVYGGTGTGCWYRNIGPSNNTAQSSVWSANVPAHKTIMITPTICFVRTAGGAAAGEFIVGLTNNNTPTGTSTASYTSGNLNYINSQVEYLPLQFGPTGSMTHIMYNKTFYWTNTGTSTSNIKIRVAKSNNTQSGLRIEPRSVSWIII